MINVLIFLGIVLITGGILAWSLMDTKSDDAYIPRNFKELTLIGIWLILILQVAILLF